MHLTVTHFGFSPLKGARHQVQEYADITPSGITTNRRWALTQPSNKTVLRTVAHPQLMAVTTRLTQDGPTTHLTLNIPGHGTHTVPALEETPTSSYTSWGSPKELAPYTHEVNDALSTYLGTEVQLAYAPKTSLIYSGALSLIGTATLADIAHRAQAAGQNFTPDQAARFRCNLIVETDTPYIEESWQGRTVTLHPGQETPDQLKGLTLALGKGIGRCAVIDAHPTTGQRDTKLLKLLSTYRPRNHRGEPIAGIYAEPLTSSTRP
ncbi:MOSC N-terminal beta barrel domain-containing protein [Rothia nasimurium]|uniref:MOSC N-terminal beta barrel domain-containing protein n=1 Tax=Rothia nasimurium TaxID=85336 RepID=UPI003BA35D47